MSNVLTSLLAIKFILLFLGLCLIIMFAIYFSHNKSEKGRKERVDLRKVNNEVHAVEGKIGTFLKTANENMDGIFQRQEAFIDRRVELNKRYNQELRARTSSSNNVYPQSTAKDSHETNIIKKVENSTIKHSIFSTSQTAPCDDLGDLIDKYSYLYPIFKGNKNSIDARRAYLRELDKYFDECKADLGSQLQVVDQNLIESEVKVDMDLKKLEDILVSRAKP